MADIKTRPAHVPPSLVFDFDIHDDPALLRDPHERVRELIATAPPFFWTPRHNGHWVALRYADCFDIFRDPARFSSAQLSPERRAALRAALPEGAPRLIELTPIMLDPPDHTKFRAPLQSVFSPRAMLALKGEIEALAHELIDAVIDAGHCDFFAAVNEQLPVRVFLKMMGLPAARLGAFRALVREIFAPADSPQAPYLRIRRIVDAMQSEIEARKVTPRDDLISRLWGLDIDGAAMSPALMEDYAALLFLAGLDTVINGMSFGIRHLARDPALQRRLRENPALIADAAEELLRRYTFTVAQRRVVNDTSFAGQMLKEGEFVVLYMPAADLDAAEFAEPERFDAQRAHKTHMAFGMGPHRCLGSHLARIELQVLYDAVLRRLPEFRLDPARPVVFHAGMMLAISSLPVRWD